MTDETDNGVEDDVTAIVREHYILLRSRAQGCSEFNPGSSWDTHFRKAARQCLENRIDPREYIEVQFAAMKPYPEISQLGSKNAFLRYIDNRKDYASTFVDMMNLQLKGFEKLVGAGVDGRSALRDPMNAFDPVVVFIIADVRGYDDVKDEVRDRARVKYRTSIYYDPFFQGLIPEDLKNG